jgi:capsular exopolysaccharide synthesis family protein
MNQENSQLDLEQQRQINNISPRERLIRYLPYLPWLIACALLALFLAYLKLRYQPRIYSVSSTLMVKDPVIMGKGQDRMEDMIFANPNKNINDEMQVIRSRNLGLRVVRSLGLELQYYNLGSVRVSLVKCSESPLLLRILGLRDSTAGFRMPVKYLNEREFNLGDDPKPLPFGQPFETSEGRFLMERNRSGMDIGAFVKSDFIVEYVNPNSRTDQMVANIFAVPSGESNNIMQLTYESENPKVGAEILNQWMREYQLAGLEEKRLAAENTLAFINQQLESANDELGSVEKNIMGIRQRNKVFSPELQSEQILSAISETEKEITKLGVQQKIVDNLISYVGDTRNPYRQVGTILGIEEPTLAAQVIEFNNLQVQRETILKTTTRSNPMVVSMETAIEKLRTDILQNLRNVRQGISLTARSFSNRNQEITREVYMMPAKEREILDVSRRQKILEQLYSFLLEKKLETSILSASTISNAKIIEYARPAGLLVSPNSKVTYIIALLLGLGIPILILFLIEYLNDRVRGRFDVTRVTQVPIIGEVSHSEEPKTLVVSRTSRRFISEQFRIIRTNIKYVIPSEDKMVFLVTSSTSGEGKSFVSTNLGAVMALSGKRTVILEFDIRKPKIMSGLGLPRSDGLTNYLIGNARLEDLPVPVPEVENLFVIPCGPIPPNPSELILDGRMNDLFAGLKDAFDVVVIDTAPVGLVGDAMVLGKYADATLYVVRHNYTFKKQLVMVEEIYKNKRLPKMSLVLNDIDIQAGYGGYYGYGGYGYSGYGYGQGSEYFDDGKKRGRRRKSVTDLLMDPLMKLLNVQKIKPRR